MSITARYYRLPASERNRVTRDQQTWNDFRREIRQAFSKTLHDVLAAIPDDLSPEDKLEMIGEGLQKNADPRVFRLEKDWHILGYLFTGRAEIDDKQRPDEPLHNLIYSGNPLSVGAGYGSAYLLDEPTVATIAKALNAVDRSRIKQRFVPQRMEGLEIYAPRDEDEIDSIFWVIDRLADFFGQAAASNEQIIRSLE